jgi:cobalamin biosynthesis Mg chelatase CobN
MKQAPAMTPHSSRSRVFRLTRLAPLALLALLALLGAVPSQAGTARVPPELKYVTGEAPLSAASSSPEAQPGAAGPAAAGSSSPSSTSAKAAGAAGSGSAAGPVLPAEGAPNTEAGSPGAAGAEKPAGKAESRTEPSKAPRYIVITLVVLVVLAVGIYLKNREDDDD